MKDTNPKDALAANKVPLHLCPPVAKYAQAMAAYEGAWKYGAWNWRDKEVRLSVYLGAIERHLAEFASGCDTDGVGGVPHLGSIMQSCAIILDAAAYGKLVDDRPHIERPGTQSPANIMQTIREVYPQAPSGDGA